MTEEELEAVLAHEISHIVNGDMVTMTLLQGVINAFVIFLARAVAYAITTASKGNNNRRGSSYLSFYLLTFLFEMIFMVFGTLIIAAFSRWREFRADKGSADLVGPEKMVWALEKLKLQTKQEKLPASCKALMINLQERSFFSLFATHPPLDARIQRLKESSAAFSRVTRPY